MVDVPSVYPTARRACEHGGVTRPDIRGQWNANAAAWTELSRAGFDVYRDLVNRRRSPAGR